ncbi:MAG TPA: glycosyltransferase family 39 protein [Casimicrobiaceae bacterium]|nr:glycosyltransferase family 39 protein [Casimicrobiaceae bacterium]
MPSKAVRWAVFALLSLLWFADLDVRRLIHPDEGRYGEIAREMYVTGDWTTPRVNGLKYFEKPPFQYWATATAYRLFGVDEWTARLWPALAGWLAVIAIGYAGFALGGIALGTFAGLALAGMLWHAAMAQIVTLDSGLAFFLALAFAALVTAQRPEATEARRRAWMWLAWAALAGATLSKGLIGIVLPGGALVIYSLLTRDLAIWRRVSLASGLALFLALTAPWFILVSVRNDEFARFFFIHEHFERYLTTEHQRVAPWYYFVPVALIGSLPWVTVLVCGARRTWRESPPNALGFSWQRFALVWAAFVFVFFSASGSKLASYILPMFAPLALVVGSLLIRLEARRLFRLTLPIAIAAAVAAVGLALGFDRYAPRFGGAQIPASVLLEFGAWLKPAFAVAAVGGIGALIAFRAADRAPIARFWGVAALSLSTLAMLQLAVAGFDAFSPVRSTSAILRAAQASGPFANDAPFYQVGMYDQTAPFYLGRTTRVVAFRDELALGIDAEPSKQLPTLEAWSGEWSALSRGYAMIPPELHQLLAAQGVPMRELARDSRRVIVSRQ